MSRSDDWTRTQAGSARLTAPERERAARLAALGRTARILAFASALVYLLAISAYLLTHGGWPTPDYLIPPLLLFALAIGRGWPFVLDWAPFLFLVLSWQATAGVADQFGRPVHVVGPIQADEWLFRGHLPTLILQGWLFDPNQAHWYDWAATMQHALHFVLPVAVGMVIWLRSRAVYWRYVVSVLVVFYLGFAGYVLYPAAPPWMAAGLYEVIPPVHRVAVETVQRLPASAPIALAYNRFSANEVAAMPSLHAAVPMLLTFVLIRLYGRWALPALLYPLTMGFNLVYLGEHYVVDVLTGYAVALIGYGLVWLAPDVLHLRLPAMAVRVPAALRRSAVWIRAPRGPVWLAEQGTLVAIAIASVVIVFSSLRPARTQTASGPLVPGLQVQAGQVSGLDPVPCDEGASSSLTIGNLLVPVTGNFAVYVYDLDAGACYSLSANVSFPPPRAERLPSLAARAPVQLSPLMRMRQGVEYYALRSGPPAQPLIDAGLPADDHYLLVVLLGDVPDVGQATAAVDQVTTLVIAEPGAQ